MFTPVINSLELATPMKTTEFWMKNYFVACMKYFSLAQALDIDILNLEFVL